MITRLKFVQLAIIIIISESISFGQIVTGNFNSRIPCCSGFPILYPYIDTFDIDNDTICEFWIQGLSGIDDYGFSAIGCQNVQLSKSIIFGNAFPKNSWNWYATGMPATVQFNWGDWWLPNTGAKYLGFRRINSVADTTYGWVKIDFVEDKSGPFDTLLVLDYAYNTISNMQLAAGQTSLTATHDIELLNSFLFFPNPTIGPINLSNLSIYDSKIDLLDIFGKNIQSKQILKESFDTIDLSNLSSGGYLLHVTMGKSHHTYRILKQ